MDQYVVEFEFAMMYFDMVDLINLIKESGNENLKDYTYSLQEIIDNQNEQ